MPTVSLAKTSLRVPVVVYNELSRTDESRLFIDINTKQRPVPNELLLDIKKLAEYENDTEQLLGEVFDLFHQESDSVLLGLTSASQRSRGKISRVTFNAALKPLFGMFGDNEAQSIYEALNAYMSAFVLGANGIRARDVIAKPTVFKGTMLFFGEVAQRVKDKFGKSYSVDNFQEVLDPMFDRLKASVLKSPSTSYKDVNASLIAALKQSLTL